MDDRTGEATASDRARLDRADPDLGRRVRAGEVREETALLARGLGAPGFVVPRDPAAAAAALRARFTPGEIEALIAALRGAEHGAWGAGCPARPEHGPGTPGEEQAG